MTRSLGELLRRRLGAPRRGVELGRLRPLLGLGTEHVDHLVVAELDRLGAGDGGIHHGRPAPSAASTWRPRREPSWPPSDRAATGPRACSSIQHAVRFAKPGRRAQDTPHQPRYTSMDLTDTITNDSDGRRHRRCADAADPAAGTRAPSDRRPPTSPWRPRDVAAAAAPEPGGQRVVRGHAHQAARRRAVPGRPPRRRATPPGEEAAPDPAHRDARGRDRARRPRRPPGRALDRRRARHRPARPTTETPPPDTD